MKTIPHWKAVLGTLWALALVPLTILTFLHFGKLTYRLVGSTDMKVSPVYTAGELAGMVDHGHYLTILHKPVPLTLLWDRKKQLVQVDWKPAAHLPKILTDEVDFDFDGKKDFRVVWNMDEPEARVISLDSAVIEVEPPLSFPDQKSLRIWVKPKGGQK